MISVTSLSSYLYCQRKLFLERVLGLFELPKAALIKGTVRHETYDLINKGEEALVRSITKPILFEELNAKYRREYDRMLRVTIIKNKQQIIGVELLPEDLFMQVLPLIRNEAGTRSKQLFDFFSKHNVFGEELWQKLTPKILSEQKIDSPNLGLKGIIDQIEVYGEEYVPIELKTGKCPKEGVWPGHRIQVAAYALLIEDFFKKDVKEAFVNYLDSQERRQILMNQFLRLEVVGLIDKVKSLLSRYELPGLSGNENKCCMCSLKDKCFDDAYLKKLLEDKKSKTLNIRAPT